MIKRYCFTDEAESLEKLFEAGYMIQDYEKDKETGEDVPVGVPHFPHNMKGPNFDVMVLGTLSRTTGDVDGEGNPAVEVLEGWHVDVLTQMEPEVLEPFLVIPKKPLHCV